jgi:hypothetical protein
MSESLEHVKWLERMEGFDYFIPTKDLIKLSNIFNFLAYEQGNQSDQDSQNVYYKRRTSQLNEILKYEADVKYDYFDEVVSIGLNDIDLTLSHDDFENMISALDKAQEVSDNPMKRDVEELKFFFTDERKELYKAKVEVREKSLK